LILLIAVSARRSATANTTKPKQRKAAAQTSFLSAAKPRRRVRPATRASSWRLLLKRGPSLRRRLGTRVNARPLVWRVCPPWAQTHELPCLQLPPAARHAIPCDTEPSEVVQPVHCVVVPRFVVALIQNVDRATAAPPWGALSYTTGAIQCFNSSAGDPGIVGLSVSSA